MLRDLRTSAAAPRVAEQRQVLARATARRTSSSNTVSCAELDEVVAAAARAELRPGASFSPAVTVVTRQSASITSCCRRDLKRRAHAEARLALDRIRQTRLTRPPARSTGRSSTVSFIRQAMSTPTAYGITASSVASTPPIGSP